MLEVMLTRKMRPVFSFLPPVGAFNLSLDALIHGFVSARKFSRLRMHSADTP